MGEKKIDITDDSRGVLGNNIIGHAYIDEERLIRGTQVTKIMAFEKRFRE